MVVLAVLLGGLFTYKSLGGIKKLEEARLKGSISARADVVPGLQPPAGLSSLRRSASYLHIVWPAMLFGVLIGAAVRTFVSPDWLARLLGQGAAREQLVAAAVGAPLMLCSCCVAPLFSSVYERSRKLGPSLALMMAAPGLNPAALALAFTLFPLPIAGAKLAMTLVAAVLAARLAARLAATTTVRLPVAAGYGASGQKKLLRLTEMFAAYGRSCAYVAWRTVPLIVLGIGIAMLLAERVPPQAFATAGGTALVVGLVSLLAVPITLPSLFEVPLAFSLLAAGAPAGAAAAVLFAGPIINLPSLLVVGRVTGWKVPAALATSVWLIAVAGGLLVR